MAVFDQHHIRKCSELLYSKTGIALSDNKQHLLSTRLGKVMDRARVETVEEYYQLLTTPGQNEEVQRFVDALTTNTTEFFRESPHFDAVRNHYAKLISSIPSIKETGEIRVWSAGCSTGQEPVTLALLLADLSEGRFRINVLATDISTKVLRKASAGLYTAGEVDGIPKHYLSRYFTRIGDNYQVKPEILQTIRYRHFNLMEPFPFKKEFHMVFCRNVMIYFDSGVQQQLISKFYHCLAHSGLFFIGHAESLVNKHHHFQYVGPSLYEKPERSGKP